MNLSIKINIILAFLFLAALAIGGVYTYHLTQKNALKQVTNQAELLMENALAVRKYTIKEIRPLLNSLGDGKFHPQVIPAYAATQTAFLVRARRDGYTYKEAVLNPTNPRDLATDYETALINRFKNDGSLKKLTGVVETNSKKSFYIASPIKITNESCLECHSTPEVAPPEMLDIYGSENGFGWELNTVLGIQKVSVPYELASGISERTFNNFIMSLCILFLVLFITVNLMIRFMILNPVKAMTTVMDELSKGHIGKNEIEVRGKDELSDLAKAHNRMRQTFIKLFSTQKAKNS